MENMTNREHWITRLFVIAALVLSVLIDHFNVPAWLQEHTELLNEVMDICMQLTGNGG